MAVAVPAPSKMVPFTVPHFTAYASRLVLDTGDYWKTEDFQIEVFRPVLDGVKEVWAVLPEGQTKTTMMAGYALYHCDYTRAPWVPLGASSRDQAEVLFGQAVAIIRETPGMEQKKKGGPGRFRIYEGYRKIVSVRNGGRGIRVYAADVTTGDGVIPTLAMCDEGHRWPNLELYRLWKGKLRKRQGQIIMISTAGEPGGEFEETRDKIREMALTREVNGGHVRSIGKNIIMNEWRVSDPAKIGDMAAVKAANPFSGITEESLLEEYEAPTMDLGEWKRLKPLAADTPIPTPTGWSTMGDLRVGDRVLNADGLPTAVRATTPVEYGRDCYRVGFSDGSSITASDDHLWQVEDVTRCSRQSLLTTEQIFQTQAARDGRGARFARWKVRTSEGRACGTQVLPVDPYVFGLWLGDGSAGTGHIRNGDKEVWDEIVARGYKLGSLAPSLAGLPNARMQTLLGLRVKLRALGVLGSKHIPETYLLASRDDRWQLLQGLIDSDGSVSRDGRVTFVNTNPTLVGDVRQLIWSLGRPCTITSWMSKLNGLDCGTCFGIEIACDSRHPVARLPRKLARMRAKGKTCDYRRISLVERVATVPVCCIAVDSEDSMFLAGRAMVPTHNCNIPSRPADLAITEEEWDRAWTLFASDDDDDHPVAAVALEEQEMPEGQHIDLGVDVAWKHDTFALQPAWRASSFLLLGAPAVLHPPQDGSMLHPSVVKDAFEKIYNRNPIDTVVMDMERAEDIASWMSDEFHVEVIDRTQGPAMQVEDYDAFMKGLRNGTLRHTGDPVLRRHVMNSIAIAMPGGKRKFDRPSQSRARKKQVVRVIDALVAAAMVNHYCDMFTPDLGPMVAWR